MQKLDERRAYEANPVASMVRRQWLGGTCPPRHEIRSFLAIATAAESLGVARLDDRFAPAINGRPIIALRELRAPRKVLLRQFAAKPLDSSLEKLPAADTAACPAQPADVGCC